jgi:hypothetical protein
MLIRHSRSPLTDARRHDHFDAVDEGRRQHTVLRPQHQGHRFSLFVAGARRQLEHLGQVDQRHRHAAQVEQPQNGPRGR